MIEDESGTNTTVNPRCRCNTERRESEHIGQVSTSPRSQCDGRIPSATSPSTHDTDAPRRPVSPSTSVRCRHRHVHSATDVYCQPRHLQPKIPTARRESSHIGQVSTSPRSQCDGRIPSATSPSTHDTDAPWHPVYTSVKCRRRHVYSATDVYRQPRHRQPMMPTHLATPHPTDSPFDQSHCTHRLCYRC